MRSDGPTVQQIMQPHLFISPAHYTKSTLVKLPCVCVLHVLSHGFFNFSSDSVLEVHEVFSVCVCTLWA